MTHPLDAFLANAQAPVLLVAADDPVVATLPTGFEGSLLALSQVEPGKPVKRGWKSVLLVASDRAALRRTASVVPRLGQCRTVGVWLTESSTPLLLHPRGEWAPMSSLNARPLTDGGRQAGTLTVARFDGPVGAHQVLAELARQAVPGADTTHGGLVVAYADRPPAAGLDVRARLLAEATEAGDAERDVPPDVVVASRVAAGSGEPEAHHVIDRSPTVVTDVRLGPVDELVYNPVGWRKDWDRPVIDLPRLAKGPAGVTEAVVEQARSHQGVRVRLGAADDPSHVLRLAMAGVPLVATGTEAAFSAPLTEALAADVDLDDPLAREEHALRVRRATFDAHSTLAWRSALAGRAGVRHVGDASRGLPPVSALLVTMRPHQLDFAVGQVARQVGADVELVVATHGFRADEAKVREILASQADSGSGDRPLVLIEAEQDAYFGDVLTTAARAASAEVLLKIDDDDWYSPHAVHDLLMARRFTGADVVGMPSEFVYLEEADVTVRRNHPSECYNRFVAGGTILIDRGLLRALGDFRRVRRFVDAQLLSGVEAAGGRIYRTHGLGYVLRRTSGGHTWARDAEEFRSPDIVDTEWPGFHPSSELGMAAGQAEGRA